MPLTVGSRLGHYDVTALIGEGGMGQVSQATDTKLNRQVALHLRGVRSFLREVCSDEYTQQYPCANGLQ